MRVLYVCIGLLLGVSLSARVANLILDKAQAEHQKALIVSALYGYNEGWRVGKERAADEYRFSLYICNDALKRMRESRSQ
jgi:hypothetical protein